MLGKKDMLILSHLRCDARETLTTMSRKTAIPVSTIYDRLKAQEKDIIKGYTAILDFSKLGYNARCKIMLKVPREKKDDIEKVMLSHENINSIYKINNGYDFMLEGIFRDIRESEDFLEFLELKYGIRTKQVFYIIEDIKREAFLANPEWISNFGLG